MNDWDTISRPDRQYAGPVSNPDRYALDEVVSQGMEGRLWRASLPVDGHRFQVAVKEIHQRNVGSLEEWLERWERQAELLRSLDHPGLVRVREVFQGVPAHRRGEASPQERSLFLVMNWANGRPLDDWVRDRDRPDRLGVLEQVAAAVQHLHSGKDTNGVAVLHRDIKPQNIIVSDDGHPRLVDFGFARLADGADYTLVGSAHYMAPEIPLGAAPTPASDRYSFGCVAFYVLSGERVDASRPASIEATITALQSGGLDPAKAQHLRLLLSQQPDDRPGDLEPWCKPSPPIGATGAGVVGGVGAATVMRRPGWLAPDSGSAVTPPPVSAPPVHPGGTSSYPPASYPPASYPPSGVGASGQSFGYSSLQGSSTWPPQPGVSGTAPTVTSTAATGSMTSMTSMAPAPTDSGRSWPVVVGVALTVAAVLIGVVTAVVWFVQSSDGTSTRPTPTTTTTSTSVAPVSVPQLAGRSRADAESILAQLGLTAVVQYIEDPQPGETVLQVAPDPGSGLPPGSQVRIVVSNPTFTMPDLRGDTLDSARTQLAARGHVPAYVRIDPSSAPAGAEVTSQEPAPGAAQPKNGPIVVRVRVDEPTVSEGPSEPPQVVLPPPTSQP